MAKNENLYVSIIIKSKSSIELEYKLLKRSIFFNILTTIFKTNFYLKQNKGAILNITELNIFILDKVIHEVAPELDGIYNIREDESEEQQIKTGRLHENRILGIILKFYLEGRKRVTTREVEIEYKKYFKEIARSTISTYLNMLKKEAMLIKERDGRIVYYMFQENPPKAISGFWFTRLFCIDPPYFYRAIYYASLYSIAQKIVLENAKKGNEKILEANLKYLIGVIILLILKNRNEKCTLCQFGKQEKYVHMIEELDAALKDRIDVLPTELLDILKQQYSEIELFGGMNVTVDGEEIEMINNLLKYAHRYNKDIEFQLMVLGRRLESKSIQKAAIEGNTLDIKEEKITD